LGKSIRKFHQVCVCEGNSYGGWVRPLRASIQAPSRSEALYRAYSHRRCVTQESRDIYDGRRLISNRPTNSGRLFRTLSTSLTFHPFISSVGDGLSGATGLMCGCSRRYMDNQDERQAYRHEVPPHFAGLVLFYSRMKAHTMDSESANGGNIHVTDDFKDENVKASKWPTMFWVLYGTTISMSALASNSWLWASALAACSLHRKRSLPFPSWMITSASCLC
jgi:hypothetical protein